MNDTLSTGLILVVATAIIGLMVWSVQRIVSRIERIGDQLALITTRVAVIESKQDTTTELAARADKVGRATAAKVGVRLPKGLSETLTPASTTATASATASSTK